MLFIHLNPFSGSAPLRNARFVFHPFSEDTWFWMYMPDFPLDIPAPSEGKVGRMDAMHEDYAPELTLDIGTKRARIHEYKLM